MNTEESNIPTTIGEIVEISAKTALSVIPVGGTLITCVWDSVKANAAAKRMQEWKDLVEERLSSVEETLEDIGSNEHFTTAIMRATDSALKTMEHEKRVYLANAVLNAVTCSYQESIMMIFLDMIDRYSVWHLQILDFFSDPTKFEGIKADNYMFGSPMEPLSSVYPEFASHRPIVDRIIKELYNDGLMTTENIHCTMSGGGVVASRTTEFGLDFIRFITREE